MTSNDVFALAAHLHALLRRKTGRVTDTEWLPRNADHAREIVRFTRGKATADALKVGQISASTAQGAATPRSGGFAHSAPGQPGGFTESTLLSAFGTPRKEGDDPETRYVGGIR